MEDSGMTDDKPKDNESPSVKSMRLTPEEIEALRAEDRRDCELLDILLPQMEDEGLL